MNSLDFIAKSQQEKQEELESLCCCQYIDKDQNKFHILGCCCNCEYFDLVFTKYVLHI